MEIDAESDARPAQLQHGGRLPGIFPRELRSAVLVAAELNSSCVRRKNYRRSRARIIRLADSRRRSVSRAHAAEHYRFASRTVDPPRARQVGVLVDCAIADHDLDAFAE